MSQPNLELEEDLSALLDGELSPAEQAALEARLSEDPALQARYDELAEARAFFGKHGAVAAPDDLLGSILAAAEAEGTESNVVQMPFWQKPLGVPIAGWAVAAAALLVVYVALPTFDGGEPADTNAAARAPGTYDEVASWSAPKKQLEAPAEAEPQTEAGDAASDDAVAVVEQPQLDNTDADKAADLAKELNAPAAYGLTTKSSPKDAAIDAKLEAVAQKVAAEQDAKRKEEEVRKKKLRLVGEKEPAQQLEGAFAQVPYQYVLYTDDHEALMQLSAIAGRYRGELGAPNDQPLQMEELASGSEATVVVKIPAHALQDFGRAIEGLGNVYSAKDGRVFAGDPVEVRVKVQLAAGPPGQADDQVPAAARQKQSMDLESIEE